MASVYHLSGRPDLCFNEACRGGRLGARKLEDAPMEPWEALTRSADRWSNQILIIDEDDLRKDRRYYIRSRRLIDHKLEWSHLLKPRICFVCFVYLSCMEWDHGANSGY